MLLSQNTTEGAAYITGGCFPQIWSLGVQGLSRWFSFWWTYSSINKQRSTIFFSMTGADISEEVPSLLCHIILMNSQRPFSTCYPLGMGLPWKSLGRGHNQPEAGTLGPHYKNEREREIEKQERKGSSGQPPQRRDSPCQAQWIPRLWVKDVVRA